ncbi:MAG: HTH-type transcriptional repressor BepR [Syntrophorhabdaceae bacterium PtaU1.Bin034]|nr:MAG: HTH-type transcriptional repressor BepR [Syntrophorhabdaceae bacterium PtaU1.Bin034]
MRNQKTPLKEEIIDKSIKLFLQKGYNATRVEDITDATSVSKAAFYLHFESKAELLETIVDRYESLFLDPIVKAVQNSEGDFLHKIKYSHKWAADFAYNNKDLCVGFMTISAEMVGSGTKIESKIKAIKARYRALFKELLEQGRREGMIKDKLDIDLAAHVINAIHDGVLIEWYANSDEIDGAKLALAYRDITLNGILK